MITGASAGVGRALARAFARRGAAIGLLARGRAGLEAARQEVDEAGGRALVLQADVARPEQVDAAAAALEAAFGPVDIWVNNAMASVFSPVTQMTAEEYKRVTEVTYLGVVHGTLAALRQMRPRDRGVIVQVGSALAYRGIPLQSAYCAAKHVVQGFCDSLRSELLRDGSSVKLTMVQLPAINTPQFDWVKSRLPHRAQPVPPIFQPEDVADAIIDASDGARAEVYVGVPTLVAIVGNKIAPRVGDWYLSRSGYESQQTEEPEDPARPHNLWSPVDENRDFGAHGRFDERATATLWPAWATQPRTAALAAAMAALAIAVALSALGSSQRS